MNYDQMLERVRKGDGFIAALDQSGGSTPKALKGYGIEEGAWADEQEMFGLIHAMRSRIISSPCFTGEKVLGAILFERTMDGTGQGARSAGTASHSATSITLRDRIAPSGEGATSPIRQGG